MAAATLGLVTVPGPPVEAVIALSIMFVASELLKRDGSGQRFSERYPWTVSFAFGLLHGFGFAGALSEIGLPEGDIPLALLSFNVGVELGQILFLSLVIGLALLGAPGGPGGDGLADDIPAREPRWRPLIRSAGSRPSGSWSGWRALRADPEQGARSL